MWKRRLGAAFLLVAFCLPRLAALPSDWRSLDTPQLLAEAARRIETLQRLNESLRQQVAESKRKSEELATKLEESLQESEARLSAIEKLQARLATLQTDWEQSEQLRRELTASLTSLQSSLKSCREEAKAKGRKAMLGGFAAGVAVGVVVIGAGLVARLF
jgi:DNA repair exonuclease SbcCD ATPase subunit